MIAKKIALPSPSPFEALRGVPAGRKPSRRAKIALLLACAVSYSEAHAVDSFSRACRFDQIPHGLQGIAAPFFSLLGAPGW